MRITSQYNLITNQILKFFHFSPVVLKHWLLFKVTLSEADTGFSKRGGGGGGGVG